MIGDGVGGWMGVLIWMVMVDGLEGGREGGSCGIGVDSR